MDISRNRSSSNNTHNTGIGGYAWLLILFWTLVVGASLGWALKEEEARFLEIARAQARAAFEKDLLFRRWNASHGGVYAPVTDKTPPNPHLEVDEQNIVTPSGRELTLINPAYMTRQVHELQEKTLGLRGHITSNNPIRPENAPDPWERKALEEYEKGSEEISSIEVIEEKQYMRLMRPLTTEKACLKCHEKQGYKEGDIRGGISVSVPIKPLLDIAATHKKSLIIGHSIFWILGLAGVSIGSSRIRRGISQLHLSETALEEKSAYLDSILHSSTDMAIVATDPAFRILFFNSAAEKLSGFSANSMLKKPITEWPEGSAHLFRFQEATQSISQKGEYTYTVEISGDEGTRFIESRISGIRSKSGELIGYVQLARDITKRLRANAIIEHQALYDPLTDLPNRRTFTQRLEEALVRARRHNHRGALLFIDLDYFKAINDTYGHTVGDELLKEVGTRLTEALRKEDTGGRLSGDEFVVLLEELDSEVSPLIDQANHVAEKIAASLNAPYLIDSLSLSITTSIGIALYPDNNTDAIGIIKQADIAMYQAKAEGRNTIRFFQGD